MSPAFAESPAESPVTPIPPRYWWLRRLAAAAAVCLLLLLGVRLWWGHVAQARLEARLAELRAQGEPVAISDFATPPIAEEDNAATLLSRAAAALPRPSDPNLDLTQLDRRSCAEHLTVFQEQLRENAQVFDLVRAARDKPDADWGVRMTSPASGILLPFLSPQRHLAKFLAGTALIHHLSGDDAAAIEGLQDLLALGNRIDAAQPPTLITHLVAIAIHSLVPSRIEEMAPNLNVTGAAGPPPNVTPAARAEVQAVIAALLDDRKLADGWRHAIQGERAFQFDAVQSVVNRTLSGAGFAAITGGAGWSTPVATPVGWVVSPAWELDALRLLDVTTRMLRAGSAADWPAAQAQWPPQESASGPIHAVSHMMSEMLLPSLDRALVIHYRAITMRRLAALGLAMRLYELDNGRRPETLAELAPAYIPAIPRDPFDPGGGALRYAPHGPSPVLYSVGVDGVDDHGAFSLRSGGTGVDLDVMDMPFFLNGDRPLPPPARGSAAPSQPASTQAVPDDQQPVDAEREQREEQPQQ